MESLGTIFNIQRFSTHDGPGIRTTVFLKGCPLRCQWCANPESQSPIPQLMVRPVKCVGCGACERICPEDAIIMSPDGRVDYPDWEKCSQCFSCVGVCPSFALGITGEERSAQAVMETVKRDALFYRNTGGGVTFSGGEALMQPDFLYALMGSAKDAGIHIALDTTGFARRQHFERILPLADLVLFDVKLLDNDRHEELTGVGLNLIHENLKLVAGKTRTWFRIPIISGINDKEEHMDLIGSLARKLGVEKISLLPFHDGGIHKMAQVGMKENGFQGETPGLDHLKKLSHIVTDKGVKATIGI